MFKQILAHTALSLLSLVPVAAAQAGMTSTEPVNAECPIGKEPVVPGAGTVQHNGKTFGLCCSGCGNQFLAWDDARKDAYIAQFLEQPGETQPDTFGIVRQVGRMREVMKGGKTEGRIELGELLPAEGLIAVGAVEGLAGEITVADGSYGVTVVSDGMARTRAQETALSTSATLLTAAHVASWNTQTVLADGRDLEAVVRDAASASGINLEDPFAFIVEPALADLAIHVINGYCPVGQDPEQIGTEPWRWEGTDVEGTKLVGFYAMGKAGEMTHHGTSIHAHAMLTIDDQVVSAHVDKASLTGELAIRFPADRVTGSVSNQAAGGDQKQVSTVYPYPLDTCPVGGELGSMGDPIIRQYDGREVRFCCDSCIAEFEAHKDEYWQEIDAKIIEQQRDSYPIETCVVSGAKLRSMGEPVELVAGNRLVKLCCEGCLEKFKSESAHYLSILAGNE